MEIMRMNNLRAENFYIISFSYKNLNLEEREEFVRTGYKKIMEDYFQRNEIKGYTAVETCLRVELYLETGENFDIDKFLNKMNASNTKIYKGAEAVNHLLTVICGLDSVIKGEDQILAQIKKAYLEYMENGKTSALLNIIFNKAIETGKKFRSISGISQKNLSLDSIAVKFIKSKFSDLENKNIFIIGVGELSQEILAILHKINTDKITMTNRSRKKSTEVQKLFHGVKTAEFDEKYKVVKESDIIISATSAPHLVLKECYMKEMLGDGKERFFLDLAVPRDIDVKLKEYENVTLFHLEDIWDEYNKNIDRRNDIAEAYYYIIEEQIEKLGKKLENRYLKN
jgi:glutamyl-tRNA reductase